MDKLNVAVFFGGCSPEYKVSLESACAVIRHLDRDKYVPVIVGISRRGDWFYYNGDVEKIRQDTWLNAIDAVPAALSPGRSKHRLFVFRGGKVKVISIDAAFPVLHGKNGEDGSIQGLIEMAGIPLIGCGTLASSLCMDKDRAHRLVSFAGIAVPKALVIEKQTPVPSILAFAEQIGYPLFVKPVRAGSSYGITKVGQAEDLLCAAKAAFAYDSQVMIEEGIDGFEVGCAVMGTETLTVGAVDEIELAGGFFDYTEKYTLKTSAIHVPARIHAQKAEEIQRTAKIIYRLLGCSGFARVDMFLTPAGTIIFNEVNTIPGFTEHSRYPGMMKAAGFSFAELLSEIIEQAVRT